MKLRTALSLILFCALLPAGRAEATVANQSAAKKAAPTAKGISCKTCHQNAIGRGGDLNAYGAALQKGKLDFKGLEAVDSDGDGVPNGKELEAGTNPGEATPKPSAQRWLQLESAAWAAEEKAEYIGSESCAACHAKEAKEFKRSTHARISIPEGVQAQSCEMCHGPGSLHAAAGGGKGVGGIINPRKDPSACFACHLDKKAEFKLPFRHPVMEGKMSCADCHSAHGEEIRPWTATSMEGVNEACFKCHKEQRGPFAWEHEALREGCTTCHKVHGSIHDKMLVARDNNLCLRCHTQVNFPTIGKQAHGGRLPQGTCFSAGCHTAVHGSNFDDHLRY
ncbi:MAG: cytochrome c3 family protein [Candidatus Omnitrophota bacterium]|nr:cytochrome c3 family protein [Candidatus Omnitrophota bacterium]